MNRVVIEYCPQCRWLLRAAWTLQELLTTFPEELQEVALRPGSAGVFRISLNAIRDRLAPQRGLGHSDRRD